MEYYRLTIPIPKRPWQWVRYRIGSVMLLMVIVAILLSWRHDHRKLAAELRRMQNPSRGYGANQALGAPNTQPTADASTAWASLTADDSAEWLIVEFDSKVVPKAIIVHENCNPGAVVKATHFPTWGKEQVLWQGKDPSPVGAGSGISRLPVQGAQRTGRIKLYVDSQAVPGWNEIDAVGLELSDGTIMWATDASSSSSYGSNFSGTGNGITYVY